MLELAQTLHGYDQGHRLLAEGGDLSDDERSILDRLSDLSGYLPSGVVFERYYTGFPCGRYYAFACTWLDTAAPRGGTVLTHTLLIPRERLASLSDLFALRAVHRRPATAEERAPYRRPLSVTVVPLQQWPAPPPEQARAALALYFGQRERPILWMDDRQPVAVVRLLWHIAAARWRERLSFCTLALQERTIEQQPFVFLGLPAAAQGAFHKFAARRAWWRDERLDHPELLDNAIVDELTSHGRSVVETLQQRLLDAGFPMVDRPSDLLTARKFLQVRTASRERLTAARARVDLMARLWPQLSVEHHEWQRAFDAWLFKQSDAPIEPRPLWELIYLMSKPLVWSLFDQDGRFKMHICQVFRQELGSRLQRVPELVIDELPALLDNIKREPVATELYDAIREYVSRGRVYRDTWLTVSFCQLLDIAVDRRDGRLLRALLEYNRHDRAELWDTWTQRQSDSGGKPTDIDAWLSDQVVALAIEVGDPMLAFSALVEREGPEAALNAAERAALLNSGMSRMGDVLERLDPETAFAWCLSCPDELRSHGVSHGGQLAKRLFSTASALADRIADTRHGARLFARCHRTASALDVRNALTRHPDLVRALIALAIEDSSLVGHTLYRVAFEQITDEQLWSREMRHMLRRARKKNIGHTLRNDLGVRLMTTILRGDLPERVALKWLALRVICEWTDELDSYRIHELLRNPPAGALSNLVGVLVAPGPDAMTRGVISLVRRLVRDASRRAFAQAHDNLGKLLEQTATDVPSGWRADILLAAFKHRIGPALITETFTRTYRGVIDNARELRDVSWPSGWSWDRGRALRHMLLDTWVDTQWPVDGFMSCLEADHALARRVLTRAFKDSKRSRQFARSLESVLREGQRDDLLDIWRRARRDDS